eukprot:1081890-Prymnesium_polylepis.1
MRWVWHSGAPRGAAGQQEGWEREEVVCVNCAVIRYCETERGKLCQPPGPVRSGSARGLVALHDVASRCRLGLPSSDDSR